MPHVLAQDMLFATLDPTMRKVQVPGTGEVVLADTVGFVSLLPHTLVEAFKATLEEVIHSDLLLHVVDVSDPLWRERKEQVQQVLDEIGAGELRQLVVLNKADLLSPEAQRSLAGFGCLISAQLHEGLDGLVKQMGDVLGVVAPHRVILPAADGRNRAWLYQSGAVLAEKLREDGSVQLTVQADQQLLGQIRQRSGLFLDN